MEVTQNEDGPDLDLYDDLLTEESHREKKSYQEVLTKLFAWLCLSANVLSLGQFS